VFGIIGLGAVGTLIAHFLNNAGYTPLVITRTKYDEVFFNEEKIQVKYVNELNNIKYTFVTVKAYDTPKILSYLKGKVIVIQNGIGGYELIKEHHTNSYPAILTYGLERNNNKVKLNGIGEIILPLEATEYDEIGEILKIGGASIKLVKDIQSYRWLKLAINCVINPLSTLFKIKNGDILRIPEDLLISIINEVKNVATLEKINLPLDPYEELKRVISITKDNKSSMLQDIEKGRKTEIDYLNGAVVKYGNKYNYRPIHNEILWKMIKTLETLNAIKEPNF